MVNRRSINSKFRLINQQNKMSKQKRSRRNINARNYRNGMMHNLIGGGLGDIFKKTPICEPNKVLYNKECVSHCPQGTYHDTFCEPEECIKGDKYDKMNELRARACFLKKKATEQFELRKKSLNGDEKAKAVIAEDMKHIKGKYMKTF